MPQQQFSLVFFSRYFAQVGSILLTIIPVVHYFHDIVIGTGSFLFFFKEGQPLSFLRGIENAIRHALFYHTS